MYHTQTERLTMEAEIAFSVSGYMIQRIKITKEGLTVKDIIKMLRSGEAMTTVHGDQTITKTATGEVLATIIDTDNECEYSDFAVNI
jgi:uncharacterized membrane protein (DUF4010 family)